MKRIYILISILSFTGWLARAQVPTQNYIQSRTMLNETGTSYMDRIVYYDGLGRPFQTVHKGITPSGSHLATLQEYNADGKPTNAWLPVTSTSEYVAPVTLKSNAPANYNNDARPYSRQVYEASPLNRITTQYGPGAAWDGKPIQVSYMTNSTSSPLNCISYSVNASGGLTNNGNYAANQLYVVRSTDEDGNMSYSFTDKLGRNVLTRQMNGSTTHDTYYVYDDRGNLCFVLQPMYQESADLARYAFQYKFDGLNRCVEKKLPGAEAVKYEYDAADRIIFIQDGNQRDSNKWTFFLYDNIGRVSQQGECVNKVVSTGTVWLTHYYDNYSFLSDNGFTNREIFPAATAPAGGLPTGSIITMPANGAKLYAATYYDNRGRIVRKCATNHLGGYDRESISYNFADQPVTREFVHVAPGKATQTELYSYVYDHASRLTTVRHKLNSNAEMVLVQNTYDNLGRVQGKTNHTAAVNSTTYAYNIRDWITGINGSKFAQNLYYNTGTGTPKYGGNISSMTWKSGTETTTRGYKFTYDGLDRLTAATYGEGTAISTNPNRFDEKVTQYDRNGNIKKLERRGKTSTTAYGIIDNLTFTHTGNQLLNISDTATNPIYAGNFNFVDGNKTTGTEYIWDKNGNLVQDYNKQIANISYNLLNLPSKLQFRYGHTVEYLYDASGNKRQVKHTTTNQNLSVAWGSFKEVTAAQKASEKVTDYCGNVIYENGVLSMIRTPEGYITLSGTTPTYHYYLRDHLGNNRVVVNQSGTVTQVNHYYPFGGVFGEGTATGTQPYKYNDKELDRTNGLDLYDYSARFMDAALGQFTTVDPLAEKYYSISPYAYCKNNPVKYIDPAGDSVRVYTETQGAGHTWISVGEGDDMVVYSYGRYNGTNKGPGGRSNTLANGPGVLLRLTGEDAKAYNDDKASTTGMSVHVITDVTDEKIANILDNKFNSSTATPTVGKYKDNPSAHVIDEYNLLNNNCTTVVVDALNSAGSDLFNTTRQITNRSLGETFELKIQERPVVPLVFKNYLNSRSLINGPAYKTK